MKKFGIALIYIISILLIFTLITTLFNYFNIMSDKTMSILKIIIPIISLFIGGIYLGMNTRLKGFCNGLKLGLIFIGIMILLNILFISSFEFKNILYYLILLITTSLGSMIGINVKKND